MNYKDINFIALCLGLLIGWKFPIYLALVVVLYCFNKWLDKGIVKHEDAVLNDIKELKSTVSKISFTRLK